MSHVDALSNHSEHTDSSSSHSDNDNHSDESNDDTVTYDKPPTNFQIPINEPTKKITKNNGCCCSSIVYIIVASLLLFVLHTNTHLLQGNYTLSDQKITHNVSNQKVTQKTCPSPVDWWITYVNLCCIVQKDLVNYGHRMYDCSANNRCLYYLSNWLLSQNLTTNSALVNRCCYDVRAHGRVYSDSFCSLSCLNTVRV